MPLLAHGIDNTPLDGSPTGTTDWYTHLVMARQAVELSLQFSGFSRQFLPVNRENIETHKRITGFEPPVINHVDIRYILKPSVQFSVLNSGEEWED